MAIQTISYTNKEDLYTDSSIPAKNKVVANDMNEIKQVVNNNADAIPNVRNGNYNSTTDTYSCDYLNDFIYDVYSTDEVKTNKVWIDGKSIYRTVIKSTSTISANTNPNIPLGLDLTTIDDFTKIETIAKQKDANVWFTASTNNSASDRLSHYINNNNMTIRNSWDFDKLIIILEYTKTTDNETRSINIVEPKVVKSDDGEK